MPSLIPRWKKKPPSSFENLSPSDRDYLIDVLRATAPSPPSNNNRAEEKRSHRPARGSLLPKQPSTAEPNPPTPDTGSISSSPQQTQKQPRSIPLQTIQQTPTQTRTQPQPQPQPQQQPSDEPTLQQFLQAATDILKTWESPDPSAPSSSPPISNLDKQILARKFSIGVSSCMKDYADKTRPVTGSSRGHIHRVLEQCVLVKRKLREIEFALRERDGGEVLSEVTRQTVGDTWRVMVSLGKDSWIDVDYALRN
ncbi:hypothetical protein N7539_005206 [Penicillium diatomitis]|uniref:Uncharacterized protein n=1 Tax=Penicillium diatomitis TaxID=2819901 RepID=A0A9X0BUH9_9EURO|nr:uncharacterized protein N7539_005206 [Penicillium diatomitis]KAJ5485218.1 hypothetical protein N7539_005206 [Penicillium diatomitis]